MMYFVKSSDQSHDCLKIVNFRGEELSLAADDNCGALGVNGRIEMAVFDNESGERIGASEYWVDEDAFLRRMAAHLGYRVEKIEPEYLAEGI